MEFGIEKAIEILERTPGTLKALLWGLNDEWTRNNEGPDTWSPFDVVGHLLHGEKTDWIPRLKIMLSEAEVKVFTPFDRFAQFKDSEGKTIDNLLDEFEEMRISNLRFLKTAGIDENDFNRKATHPSLGEVTLENLLSTWAVHDLGHIAQISRVMAKQWKKEVGPWVEYLGVLNR